MADPGNTGIYEIVNLVNGKRYVGSAVDLRRRRRTHLRLLKNGKHHNAILLASWKKYGAGAFEFRVIELCPVEMLLTREQVAIDSLLPEYNLSPTAGSTRGYRYTDEQRAKMRGRKQGAEWVAQRSAQHIGKKRSAATRANISAAMTGKTRGPRSPEHRARLSAARKDWQPSPEHMAALQMGRAAREYTEADRRNISEGLKKAYDEGRRRRDRPPEYREKIAAGLRGRKATKEHRANQSAAQRGKKRGPYNITAEERLARSERAKRTAEKRIAARWGKPTT